MIPLGLRLTLNGGREAAVRLAVIAVAVTIGAGLLLTSLAGINAVNAQNARYAWLGTGYVSSAPTATSAHADPLWGMLTPDYFDGQLITRADVAATGPDSPIPPGIARLPGPGEFYASPALDRLLRRAPGEELADRYPGQNIGTIGSIALPAPNSLIIIVGHSPSEFAGRPGAVQVRSINTTPPSDCGNCPPGVGFNANAIDLILSVVALAFLFPVLMFVISATRLSAARREQRFAAMRLVGATPRQISTISAVESSVAATIGVAAGFGLFFLLRPAIASISFTGAPFFPADLSLSLIDVLVVALGIPLAAAAAARFALRRVQVSPLGVSRRGTPTSPRAYRLIPLLLGVAELAYFLVAPHPNSGSGQVKVYLPGILLIMVGLVVAGPWLTMLGSKAMLARTRRPATLIAGRRLADNPHAAFRAISGLVLALFVATVAVGVITTFAANRGAPIDNPATAGLMIKDYGNDYARPGQRLGAAVPSLPSGLLADLRSVRGVHAVTVIHQNPDAPTGPNLFLPGVVSCADLAATPALGRCPTGADTASVDPFAVRLPAIWPAADVSATRLASLPVQQVAVATDGTMSTIERTRTVLELADPYERPPNTPDEAQKINSRELLEYQQLANVAILVSLPIAGCSLAVGVAAGLAERKRPFSLLRLTGAPLAVLRRVVAWESVVPLLIAAVVSIGMGLLAAQLFLRSQLGYVLRPPGVEFYLIVLAGIVASLAIIASTLPFLARITGPEVARND